MARPAGRAGPHYIVNNDKGSLMKRLVCLAGRAGRRWRSGQCRSGADATVKPAIVYANGGKFDKSFNEGVYERRREVQGRDQDRRRRFRAAERDPVRAGAAPLCPARPGSDHRASASPRRWRWRRSPRNSPTPSSPSSTAWSKLPNVQSVVFKEQEGSFLVGMLAAMASQERQGRLRRRHGHPADPPLPVRLRAGRQVRQSQGRADRRT